MSVADRRTYRGWGAVTGVLRLKPGAMLRLWPVFAYGNVTTFSVRPLLAMKVIALARWTLWPNWRNPNYLLFETSWAGSDQTYIPDFARIMPMQWKSIFGATKNFPGPLPTTTLLDEYVSKYDAGADHFLSDYAAGASTQSISRALELRLVVERFVRETRNSSPAEFHTKWEALMVKVQSLL